MGSKIHIQYGIESTHLISNRARGYSGNAYHDFNVPLRRLQSSSFSVPAETLQPLQEPTCPKLDNYPYTRFPKVTPSSSRIQSRSCWACWLTLGTFLSFLASLASKISSLHPSEEWMQWLQDPNFVPATFYIILTALICLAQ